MTEMVERVARALCEADGRDSDFVSPLGHGSGPGPRADVALPEWRRYEVKARAAIAAMREPTGDVIKAGQRNSSQFIDGSAAEGGPRGWDLEESQVVKIYSAMIDAAL